MFRPDKHYEERCHIKNVILVNKYDTVKRDSCVFQGSVFFTVFNMENV